VDESAEKLAQVYIPSDARAKKSMFDESEDIQAEEIDESLMEIGTDADLQFDAKPRIAAQPAPSRKAKLQAPVQPAGQALPKTSLQDLGGDEAAGGFALGGEGGGDDDDDLFALADGDANESAQVGDGDFDFKSYIAKQKAGSGGLFDS